MQIRFALPATLALVLFGCTSTDTARQAFPTAPDAAGADAAPTGGAASDGSVSDAALATTDSSSPPVTGDAAEPENDGGGGCGSTEVPAEVVEEISPANLLVLMDRSLSLTNWPTASQSFIQAIEPIADLLTVGAIFFPSSLIGAVDPITSPNQIDFRAGPEFITAWNDSWSSGLLFPGTPTDAAAAQANTALDQLANTNAYPTTVLLITDGAPTGRPGDPSQRIEAYAERWYQDRGIPTYVLGVNGLIGGAPAVAGLDPVAMAGGTGSFIAPNDDAQLAAELESIVSRVVGRRIDDCNITLSPPANAGDIVLIVEQASDGQQVQVPMGPEYWELTEDRQSAVLLDPFCEDAKAGLYNNVEFKFGCVDIPLI